MNHEQFFKNHVFFETGEAGIKTMKRALVMASMNQLPFLIYDVESTGLDPWEDYTWMYSHKKAKARKVRGARVFSVQLGIEMEDGLHCIFVYVENKEQMDIARQLLRLPCTKIGHNIKFDIQISRESGIEVNHGSIWDTLTSTRLTHDRLSSHTLKYLGNYFAGKHGEDKDRWEKDVQAWLTKTRSANTRQRNKEAKALGRQLTKEELELVKAEINYSHVPPELMIPYGLKDIWNTYLIYILSVDEIESEYKTIFEVETKLIHLALKMEKYGVMVDRPACKYAIESLKGMEKKSMQNIMRIASKHGIPDFKPTSPVQLMKMLKKLKVPDKDLLNAKNKPSTDAYVMERLQNKYPEHTFIQEILNNRTYSKLRGTYFEPILSHSRGTSVVHCNIKVSDTATGRFAVSNPSLQNIPRATTKAIESIPTVRGVFVPRQGTANYYFDYSQIEMIVFALFAQEQGMLEGVANGEDFHTSTAILMFGKKKYDSDPKRYRQMAKSINFGIIYGMGIAKLALTLGISEYEAKLLMQEYKHKFPGVHRLLSMCKKQLQLLGYVEDMFGRRYHIPLDKSYIAVNSLVQGASANLLKFAMLQTENLISVLSLEELVHILLVIHDEQDVEVDYEEEWCIPIIKLAMEEVIPIIYYGVRPKVEVEWSNEAWDKKQKLEFSSIQMKAAIKIFNSVYDKVVIDYDCSHVDWFMNN